VGAQGLLSPGFPSDPGKGGVSGGGSPGFPPSSLPVGVGPPAPFGLPS